MNDSLDADLVLVRGLPGSGKSTIAKEIARSCGYQHFENDHFFEGQHGYQHDVNLFVEARDWCFRSARDALLAGQKVVVSNVFTEPSHMDEYLALTRSVIVIECSGNYGSTHDVPEKLLLKMRRNWRPFPGALQL